MYFVKYGREYLHDPRVDGCAVLDLSLDCEENSCGFCDFTIYPGHPLYDKLRERDSDNPIEVYDDEIRLFTGFIYELGKEFYLDGHVKCKGELDFLNESIVRPYATIQRGYGLKAPTNVGEYFEWLIFEHNDQVSTNKRFRIGINQGSLLSGGNPIDASSTEYPTIIEEIKEKLLDKYGGYLVVRYVEGVRYIDWLAEWTGSNSQILDFGVNLADYTQTDDALEMATFVVPLGAKMSETEYEYDDGYFETEDTVVNSSKEYFTASEHGYTKCNDLEAFEAGVTYYEYDENEDESDLPLSIDGTFPGHYGEVGYGKDRDMVICIDAIRKYGWIGHVYRNTDITVKADLFNAGLLALKELVSPKRTIEIKAVDMHLVNPEIKPIRIGEHVRVRSIPHNLDSYFLCVSIDLDLNNPENSLYTLGTTFDTLTGQQNKRINSLNSTINKQYEAVTASSKSTGKQSGEAVQTANSALTAVNNSVRSIHDEYAVSASNSEAPQNGWSMAVPQRANGTYIWRRQVTTYVNGTSTIGSPVLVTGDKGEDGTVLRIESSRGTVFKNDSISTVLSAVIYRGSERITNSTKLAEVYGSGAYLEWSWQRIDDNAFGTILSTDPMLSNNGFNLTISAEEVNTKVTFMCQLIV